jgi:predicted DsbA family dithiol-disulfide isomerase
MSPSKKNLPILGEELRRPVSSPSQSSSAKLVFKIEVVSDVICPWCWVGKRRLEKAIALLSPEAQVKVTWRPFQLNTTMPKAGADRRQYIQAKFGSLERFAAMEERLIEVGAGEGIDFKFNKISRIPNTLDAHRLIWLGQRHDKQDEVVETLFNAYFVEGVDVGERRNLVGIAAAAGIEVASAEKMMETDEGLREVVAEEEQFKAMGIDGVPGFVVNGVYLFSGAVEPQVVAEAIREA